MGSVWEAVLFGAFGFKKRVALKVILPEIADQPHYRKMFLDEAHVVSSLAHPNVAQVLDIGEHEGILFLVVEWIDGPSLERILLNATASGDTLPIQYLLRIVADAAAGAHAVHQLRSDDGEPMGIVHRDISPHNILVGSAGISKLIDFGIAKSTSRQATATRAGHARGKPSYLAPEQAMKFGIDHRADLWGLGASLYRALRGRPPFDDVSQLLAYVYKGAPMDPLPREVPAVVEELVMRALAVDPMQRYDTAEEMRDTMERVMQKLGRMPTHADVSRYAANIAGAATSYELSTPDGTSRDAAATDNPPGESPGNGSTSQ
jgi:serine/threonine protein kinase